MSSSCRSSGLITADTLVFTGQCKLVSIHAYNLHAATHTTVKVYDNTAASGKQIAELYLPPILMLGTDGSGQDTGNPVGLQTIEFDMHGVLCRNGLYVDVTGGTPRLTIEFA